MNTETLAIYHTRTGQVAFEVKRFTSPSGRVSYSYTGKHGAGSGGDLQHIKDVIAMTIRSKPGVHLVSGSL